MNGLLRSPGIISIIFIHTFLIIKSIFIAYCTYNL